MKREFGFTQEAFIARGRTLGVTLYELTFTGSIAWLRVATIRECTWGAFTHGGKPDLTRRRGGPRESRDGSRAARHLDRRLRTPFSRRAIRPRDDADAVAGAVRESPIFRRVRVIHDASAGGKRRLKPRRSLRARLIHQCAWHVAAPCSRESPASRLLIRTPAGQPRCHQPSAGSPAQRARNQHLSHRAWLQSQPAPLGQPQGQHALCAPAQGAKWPSPVQYAIAKGRALSGR